MALPAWGSGSDIQGEKKTGGGRQENREYDAEGGWKGRALELCEDSVSFVPPGLKETDCVCLFVCLFACGCHREGHQLSAGSEVKECDGCRPGSFLRRLSCVLPNRQREPAGRRAERGFTADV